MKQNFSIIKIFPGERRTAARIKSGAPQEAAARELKAQKANISQSSGISANGRVPVRKPPPNSQIKNRIGKRCKFPENA
ncbi:MAG: hypothetical protein DBX55_03785 [Verrucomicrobia bacterium]|nr:MAG: hypothetical protein DBX55_03785 [Verrucomicrobiota bacterium]